MAVPLGPCILCAVLMMIAGCVYAVNAALPAVDENELEKQVSGGDSGARRALRLLRRFDARLRRDSNDLRAADLRGVCVSGKRRLHRRLRNG